MPADIGPDGNIGALDSDRTVVMGCGDGAEMLAE